MSYRTHRRYSQWRIRMHRFRQKSRHPWCDIITSILHMIITIFKWKILFGNHVCLWQFHNTWSLVCQGLSLRFAKGLKIPSYTVGCTVWLALHLQILLGAFAKFRKAAISFVMSVCPHGTARHPLDGFSWNLIGRFSENMSRKFNFHPNRVSFCYISLTSSYNEKCFSQKL